MQRIFIYFMVFLCFAFATVIESLVTRYTTPTKIIKYAHVGCKVKTVNRTYSHVIDCGYNPNISFPTISDSNRFHTFSISGISLTTLNPSNFANISVIVLEIENNKIEILKNNSFNGNIQSVEKLYFKNNSLKLIENGALDPFNSTITYLDLSWNKLETLPQFKSLKNLRVIVLDHNSIKEIVGCDGTCSLFPLSILEIYLNDNNITDIQKAFIGLKNLNNLKINRNQITFLQVNTFDSDALVNIDLSENSISSIQNDWLRRCNRDNCNMNLSMQRLTNKLLNLQDFAFYGINSSNVSIDLSGNKISLQYTYIPSEKSKKVRVFCEKDKTKLNKPTKKFILNGVNFVQVNPCLLEQIRSLTKFTNISFTQAQNVSCDCNLIHYFTKKYENVTIKCVDHNLNNQNCGFVERAMDVCQKFTDVFDCKSEEIRFIESKSQETFFQKYFYYIIGGCSLFGLAFAVAFIIIVVKCTCKKERVKQPERLKIEHVSYDRTKEKINLLSQKPVHDTKDSDYETIGSDEDQIKQSEASKSLYLTPKTMANEDKKKGNSNSNNETLPVEQTSHDYIDLWKLESVISQMEN